MTARSVTVVVTATLASSGLLPTGAGAAIVVDPQVAPHEPIYSLANPSYARPEDAPNLDQAAQKAKDDIVSASEQASSDADVEKVERDCAKEALASVAWDIWWAVTSQATLDVGGAAQNAAEACLGLYVPQQVNVAQASHEIASAITRGAEEASEQEGGDVYGVADWMLVADYYYVES